MGAKGEEGKEVVTLAKISIPHLPLHALRLSPPSRTLFSEHIRLELAKQRFTGEDPCWKTLKTSARDTCKRSLLPSPSATISEEWPTALRPPLSLDTENGTRHSPSWCVVKAPYPASSENVITAEACPDVSRHGRAVTCLSSENYHQCGLTSVTKLVQISWGNTSTVF